MRCGCSLQYSVLCAIILKFLFIISAIHLINACDTSPDSGDEHDDDYFEQFRTVLGDKKFIKLKNHFLKKGKETGFKEGTEQGGWNAFLCAMLRIKARGEQLSQHPRLHDNAAVTQKVRLLSKHFKETRLADINITRDRWIHDSIIEARNKKPKLYRKNSHKPDFVYEIDLTFGQCLYFLEDNNPPPTFVYVKLLLESYYDEQRALTRTPMELSQLQHEFCATIARGHHIARAVIRKYMSEIDDDTQPRQGDRKYFYDVLLDDIPNWYMRPVDIFFINLHRLAYAHSKNSVDSYVPITPYSIVNRWKEPAPDKVVIPMLYNSSECGLAPRHKTSPLPVDEGFHIDLLRTPKKVSFTVAPATTWQFVWGN